MPVLSETSVWKEWYGRLATTRERVVAEVALAAFSEQGISRGMLDLRAGVLLEELPNVKMQGIIQTVHLFVLNKDELE